MVRLFRFFSGLLLSCPHPGAAGVEGGRTSRWWSISCWGRSTSPRLAGELPDVDTGQSLLANKPGEEGPVFTPAALTRALICDHHLFVVQYELQDGGQCAGEY